MDKYKIAVYHMIETIPDGSPIWKLIYTLIRCNR